MLEINFNKDSIDKALPKLESGLTKYVAIQKNYHSMNVANNRDFQKQFNHFYRVRRGSEWQEKFYGILESAKEKNYSFAEILENLSAATGRLEASFSSKLLASANPERVVLDSVVLKNVGLKLPYANCLDRKGKIIELYHELEERLKHLLTTENGKYLVEAFIQKYPNHNITKIKMLDLVLWQSR